MTRPAASTIVLAFLAGCSFNASCGSQNLDTKKAEEELAASIEKLAKMPAKVTCPSPVKLKKDDVFDCTVTLGEAQGTFRVSQTDDKGNIHFELVEEFLMSQQIEEAIGGMVKEKTGVSPTVSCGPRVRVSTPGSSFTCTAADAAGKKLDVKVDVKDAQGNVHFSVVDPA